MNVFIVFVRLKFLVSFVVRVDNKRVVRIGNLNKYNIVKIRIDIIIGFKSIIKNFFFY